MYNMTVLGFMGIGMQELILIVAVLLLLFGGKRIPELMRGMGKGIHSFKEGMKGIDKDEAKGNDKDNKESTEKK